jgi:XRE family transcriptional regulator, fatty acid utilization regulator
LIDNDSKNKIKFLDDAGIMGREVSTTCERCGVKDCTERAIEPIVVQRRLQRQTINETLKKILDN